MDSTSVRCCHCLSSRTATCIRLRALFGQPHRTAPGRQRRDVQLVAWEAHWRVDPRRRLHGLALAFSRLSQSQTMNT